MKIGILGGMGPLAGVELQRMIIDATPVERDQDHLEVICYTNPKIPDITCSLAEDGGKAYLDSLVSSAETLVKAGASIIAIPCNTAHARFLHIQARLPVPVANMVELTIRHILQKYGAVPVGLLATTGTITEKVYENAVPNSRIKWLAPVATDQEIVTRAIRDIKVNGETDVLQDVVGVAKNLSRRGAKVILLGCTEISLISENISQAGKPVVDPMRVLAEHLVQQARVV